MQELINKIEAWGEARNLIKGSTPLDQGMKLFSEAGELADAIAKGEDEKVKDGIGDVLVVCTIICKQVNQPLELKEPIWIADNLKTKQYVIELNTAITDFVYYADRIMSDKFSHYLAEQVEIITSALTRIATAYGFTFDECIEHAYNDIKDRRGLMYQGVFIKSDDPRYIELGGK